MTAIAPERIEQNIVPTETKSSQYNRRTCTDKYWSLLFIVFVILWIAIARDVVHPKPPRCPINYNDNGTNANYSSTLFDNQTTCEGVYRKPALIIQLKIFHMFGVKVGSLIRSHVILDFWIHTTKKGNDFRLYKDVHDEMTLRPLFKFFSGVIVIWVNLVMCISLVAYSISVMRTDNIFWGVLIYYYSGFIIGTTEFRIKYFSEYSEVDKLQLTFSDCSVVLWFIPEFILTFLSYTLGPPRYFGPDRDDKIKSINGFQGCVFVNFFVSVILLALAALFSANYELNWDNPLSYIFVSINCFFLLVFHYYGLMLTSCVTSLAFDGQSGSKTYFRAIFIVTRYHFGTVCYHATLIFPRIRSAFLMNEKEFTESTKFSKLKKIYLTQGLLNDLSLKMIGAFGYNHSECMRELLRLFNSESPILKNFNIHNQMFRSCSALIIAINNLLLILFWAHGVILEPHFVLGTWLMNLVGLFCAILMTVFSDAATDVLWLRSDEDVIITY